MRNVKYFFFIFCIVITHAYASEIAVRRSARLQASSQLLTNQNHRIALQSTIRKARLPKRRRAKINNSYRILADVFAGLVTSSVIVLGAKAPLFAAHAFDISSEWTRGFMFTGIIAAACIDATLKLHKKSKNFILNILNPHATPVLI